MKIIEVCENFSNAGAIMHYQKTEKIENVVLPFMFCLSVGDIKNNNRDIIKELFPEFHDFDANEVIDELLSNIKFDTKVRIWSSKGNADNYLLVPFICNLLKEKCNNISVIYSTDYDKKLLSIKAINYRKIKELYSYEKNLSKEEINKFSEE